MAGLCGWSLDPCRHEGTMEELVSMSRSLQLRESGGGEHTVLGRRIAVALSEAGNLSGIARSGHLICAITGVYRWEDPELRKSACERDPAEVLIEGYKKHGSRLPLYLSGSFAFAVGDDESGNLLIAVDRFCSKQIAYFEAQDSLVFASSSNALRRHHLFVGDINPNAIFSYLYFHNVPLPMGVFGSVERMQAGHILNWRSSRAEASRYFTPVFDDSFKGRDVKELGNEVQQFLAEEVRGLSEGAKTGTFLSGGIDSSTITGHMQQLRGDCQAFSIGFSAENYDEMVFARTVAKHFGSSLHEYYVTPQDIIDAVPKVARANSEPFGNASAVPTYCCAKLAREHGIERLLAGDGGDELFGGNERYAYQKILSAYGSIPKFVRNVLEFVVLSDVADRFKLLRKGKSYITKSSTAPPDRWYLDNVIGSLGNSNVLTPDFFNSVDGELPLKLIRNEYEAVSASSELSGQLALDWYLTLACSDLPKVTLMCGLAGIEIAYPFLANSIVDFSSHLSDKSKVNRMQLRYFFKRAVGDFLPDQTIKKTKQGFGLPFGLWVQEKGALRDFTFDNLESLKRRGIVQEMFINDLVEKWLPSHPKYYGVMTWILLMLEQFYQVHVDNGPA